MKVNERNEEIFFGIRLSDLLPTKKSIYNQEAHFVSVEAYCQESLKKEAEGHCGFGGGDSEYDFEDYRFDGNILRLHYCNSGRQFYQVIEETL